MSVNSVETNTRLGRIRGRQAVGVQAYLGIRYAQPPTAERRFRPPQAAGGWAGCLDATRFGPRSISGTQPGFIAEAEPDVAKDIDCLHLNIWTPQADEGRRAVLVWIHGGGFDYGSNADSDGSVLAATRNLVVVAMNYRLGVEGFFDLSRYGPEYAGSELNGLRDQIEALRWVRDNIADYGGDPGCVTIAGQSAGGESVLRLLGAPEADGLYHRAIAQSPASAPAPAVDQTELLARALDVNADDLLEVMLSAPPERLLAARQQAGIMGSTRVDGVVVTQTPWDAVANKAEAGVPVICGYARDEGRLFGRLIGDMADTIVRGLIAPSMNPDVEAYLAGLAELYPELAGDPARLLQWVWVDLYRRPAMRTARAATAAGPGGWLYRFDYPSDVYDGELGACHAVDLAFNFNEFRDPAARRLLFRKPDAVARSLADDWTRVIAHFARTGEPDCPQEIVEWPRYSVLPSQYLAVDKSSSLVTELDGRHEALWKQ